MDVMALVHQADAGPGVFAEAISARGDRLHVWRLASGEPPPRDPRDCAAVLTFGGAVHPDQDDEHPWLAEEKRLLAELLDLGVPLLGVCLGAEVLAAAAGGAARRAREPEIGWYQVRLTREGASDPLLGPVGGSFRAFEWHSYEPALPPHGSALARSERSLQAFRIAAAAWGVQFHAEVTLADAELWIDDYGDDEDALRIGLDPDQLRTQTRAEIAAWNDLGRGLCARFLAIAESAARGNRR